MKFGLGILIQGQNFVEHFGLGLASFWASWPQLGLWLNPRVKTSNTFLVFRILHGNIQDFFGILYPSRKSSGLFWYSVSFTEIFKTFLLFCILHRNLQDFFGIPYPSWKSSRLFWYSISFTEIFKTFLVFYILHRNLQDIFGIPYPSRKSSRLFWYSISFTEIFKEVHPVDHRKIAFRAMQESQKGLISRLKQCFFTALCF